jgi:4'-phosphopantetheinyl transferase EntD
VTALDLLLPDGIATAESYGDPPGAALSALFPEEAAAVARAVPKRRLEFAAVRVCAREALAALGLPTAPLVPGKRGAPGWPPGVVGTMTHCEGYRGAAIARDQDYTSLGIDAEPSGPLPEGVLDVISLPTERDRLRERFREAPEIPWDRLLFSAKESVFKAWYPLTHRELDFTEADLELTPTGTFTATLLVPSPFPTFTGRWHTTPTHVLTAIAVPT